MADKEKLWSALKIFLKVGVTAILIYFVSQKIDAKTLKDLFLKSNPIFILLALILYFISAIIASWRSLDFLKSIGLNLKFGFNLRLYLLGMFYNVSLPGGVGGDGYKVYLLRKKFQLPTKRIILAMFFDRLSGLWAIGLIAVALIIFIPKIDVPATWPVVALLVGTAIYYVVMRKFFKDYSEVFFSAHLKAIALQSLQAMVVILMLLSQNFDGKFSPYLFSFLLSTLAANVPVSLGGIGAREYAMTHASTYFGMDQNLAVFLTVTFFIISTVAALSGVWFVYRSKEFEARPKSKDAKVFEKDSDAALLDLP